MTKTKFLATFGVLFALTNPAHAGDYVVISEEATVDATADAAWKVVGAFCSIADWTEFTCEMTAGNGGTGSIRVLNGEIEEIIVGSTAHSHTYMQTIGSMVATGYHGTVSVSPNEDGTSSTLRWVGIYDESTLPEDARAATRERLTGFYKMGAANMKALAEGE